MRVHMYIFIYVYFVQVVENYVWLYIYMYTHMDKEYVDILFILIYNVCICTTKNDYTQKNTNFRLMAEN